MADYHRMIASGGLTSHHRIELLQGVMVEKMTHNPWHALLVQLVLQRFQALLPAVGFTSGARSPSHGPTVSQSRIFPWPLVLFG